MHERAEPRLVGVQSPLNFGIMNTSQGLIANEGL